MRQGKRLFSPIATISTVESYLEGKNLTSGQKEAIALTATTTDQFIAWQGVAGAGKTFALNELKQITQLLQGVTEGQKITLLAGFAPSKEATKGLGEELGIEANTVASLLLSKQPKEHQPNQLWIVDEAGMLSAKDGYALLQKATAAGARVILVGDTRQLSAVEAGNPFKSLQQAGISTAHLNQSLRQKVPDLKLAAELAAAGNHVDALQHLLEVGRIQEIPRLEERSTLIAQDYLQLSPEQRRTTLVLAGTHKEKAQIMQQIRAGLKQDGTLVGEDAVVTRLKQKDLTNVQARYRHHYNIGDVVIPLREYKRAGLCKDRAYAVCGFQSDKLVLSDWSGNQVAVDPMKFRKTVYTQQTIEVCVGDSLRWTREDKQSGRSNRDEFMVVAIEERTATIRYFNGREESLQIDEPLPIDYAIASTTYSSQGKTADRVLVSSTVDPTVSQESVYVAISRAKYDLKIYAEDIDYLLEQAQESKAQETVLELLQPKGKVQVSAVPEVTVRQKVEVSEGVTETPQLRHKEKSVVSNIERMRPIVKREPPKQLEVFWTPTLEQVAPPHIEANHWQELVESSAIHPEIAALNFRSLQMGSIEQEHEAWEYLMYSDKLERTNIGQLTTGMLKRYAHIDAGGWWCDSGVNAISFSSLESTTKPQEKRWGCYKPNSPRTNPDKPGKLVKYEHPPKIDLGIFLLHVPDDIAERIYSKAGIDPSSEDRMRGFWYCTWKYNLPITITEGAKKAASLLSQGHVAIGLPGIYAGYRSKDEQGRPIKAHLHEELAVFATLGRNISFCFDYETRPETKRNIEIAISRTGSLLQQQGAKVSVVSLPGPEKGVDDLIVAHSPLAYEQAASVALPLRQWREHNKQSRHLAIVPPKKLSVQERKEQLKDSVLGQQPVNNQKQNQLPEQISHDSIDRRQLKGEHTANGHPSINQSLSPVDKEDRSIGENWHSTYEQYGATERTNLATGSYPDREPKRTESKFPELFEAISRHLELQKVEQLGADIAELNRSLANGKLPDQGCEDIAKVITEKENLPQQVQGSKAQENLLEPGDHHDRRHSFINGDRQPNSQHRGVESSEHRSLTGEQGTQELYPQTVERQPPSSEANAQRLHRSVQRSAGATEIRQNERNAEGFGRSDEQPFSQTRGYKPGTSSSQRTGDGSLRGNYGQQEAIPGQWTEGTIPTDEQWATALVELAPLVGSFNDERILGNVNLGRILATLTGQIKHLHRSSKQYKFAGLSELAQDLTGQQSELSLVEYLPIIQLVLSRLTQKLASTDQLQPNWTMAESRLEASILIGELQPEIENLAQVVSYWQSEAELEQAISQFNKVVRQEEQQQTFDFGELPELISQVNTQQLLTQKIVDIASLTQRLAQFTEKVPTVFNDMSALVEDLQSHHALSQLLETGLTNGLAALSELAADFNPKAHKFEFESMTEIAQLFSQQQTHLTVQQELESSGLLEQLQKTTNNASWAISQHIDQFKENLTMLKTSNPSKAVKKLDTAISSYTEQSITSLADGLREIPLEEIAIRLGLTLDKHDKHKWWGDGQILSINNQKFYDHLNLKGGYGAIDLVIHVQGQSFKEALKWLSDGISELPRSYLRPSPSKAVERQPFQLPNADDSKWLAVRQYLVEKRKVPAALVDELHNQGIIYADTKQNAVFLRQDIKGNVTGASLRGTYKDSSFKGLATGSQRENGWFSFFQGEGQLKRIVLVESAIDALSAAALAEQPGKAMFISTDGAGSIPVHWLQQQGVVVIAAHDQDRAGEEMAWRLAMDVSSVTRAVPTYGKDWNEQLKDVASKLDPSQWKLVAQAIGKPDAYVSRIIAVVDSGQPLPVEAQSAMQQDFSTYKQLSSNLWQWHQAARSSGYSEAYLKRIAEVAIALHHPQKPIPLSENAKQAMQQDVPNYSQVNCKSRRL
ncbi:AAA family ATPase [Chlorogloea sp. CCALA 695]|uniref:AAA family ATPase n=1 Tax=Chlorogloea sp. CCALA 695 TaxID=2107693 RepID=UPI000D05EF4C|nr:AAA family ATPase [Chlorogloea sp. CCALA 695]PSB30093.1 hypothetical protein C7B70_16995 [Chlorogloea sp. CCALA 695]